VVLLRRVDRRLVLQLGQVRRQDGRQLPPDGA
jgi:hypothetical protein